MSENQLLQSFRLASSKPEEEMARCDDLEVEVASLSLPFGVGNNFFLIGFFFEKRQSCFLKLQSFYRSNANILPAAGIWCHSHLRQPGGSEAEHREISVTSQEDQ
jgi:hypothetical protein